MKYIQTIDLAKQAQGVAFKKRAPTCMRKIKAIAQKTAQVEHVILGEDVNMYVWQKGIRAPPRKIRVEIEVKEQEQTKYAVVSLVNVESFKGLQQEKQE